MRSGGRRSPSYPGARARTGSRARTSRCSQACYPGGVGRYGGCSEAMATSQAAGKVTIPHLHVMRVRGEVITMVAAYDYPSARFADEAGIGIVLAGDCLAMTVPGHPNNRSAA